MLLLQLLSRLDDITHFPCSSFMSNSLHHCFLPTLCISTLSGKCPAMRKLHLFLLRPALRVSTSQDRFLEIGPFVMSHRAQIPQSGFTSSQALVVTCHALLLPPDKVVGSFKPTSVSAES